ncbi:MAG TPA: alpha/beta hydrolase [Chthoniobacter sp.]|jgi:pimeloyl-ACP methyl ester carboxylesterase
MSTEAGKVSVIMVHGAWAEGASWARVVPLVETTEVNVICAPLPLTTLSEDINALNRTIERVEGPVILAAHAYAGAVIGAANPERVKSLVYVAALAPDENETVAEVFYRDEPHPKAPKLAPDSHGFIWMPDEGFADAFAQNASAGELKLLAATQRPIALACIQEKVPKPIWKDTTSWFLIAEQDRMINPKTQRFMAGRMGAKIRSHEVDHAPLITAPHAVADIIKEAIASIN